MRLFCIILLFLLLLVSKSCSALILDYTIPQFKVTVSYDSISGTWGDICLPDSTSPVHMKYIRIYRCPFEGGGFSILRDKDVEGRENQPDTLDVPDDGSYYVTAIDLFYNESCASDIVHGPVPTGVPLPPTEIVHIIASHLFNVQGQLVRGHHARGVYYRQYIWSDGHTTVKQEQ